MANKADCSSQAGSWKMMQGRRMAAVVGRDESAAVAVRGGLAGAFGQGTRARWLRATKAGARRGTLVPPSRPSPKSSLRTITLVSHLP